MNPKLPAVLAAALAIICSAVALNAPMDFHYLWIVKAAAMSAAGVALLLTDPNKVLSGFSLPKTV